MRITDAERLAHLKRVVARGLPTNDLDGAQSILNYNYLWPNLRERKAMVIAAEAVFERAIAAAKCARDLRGAYLRCRKDTPMAMKVMRAILGFEDGEVLTQILFQLGFHICEPTPQP